MEKLPPDINEGRIAAIQEQLCRTEVAGGNVRTLNFILKKLNLPPEIKLDLLAQGYERRAQILSQNEKTGKKEGRNFFIPPTELEVIAAQSIARELRERVKKLTE